jgi:KDO2-lipid IV(A) lauroyltransferase
MPVEKTRMTAIILAIFQAIPLAVRKAAFRCLFLLFYHLSVKHRLIALHNLRCSFPEKNMDELITITKGVYRHLATVAAECFDMTKLTRENIHEWVKVEGHEHFKEGIAQGRGLLFIVAHFGNWELIPHTFSLTFQSSKIIYRPLDSPVLDNLMKYVRSFHGDEMMPKGGSGKRIMSLLRENQVIGILSDQNVSVREGVFVDFFGRPACTGAGLAVLAMRSGAPVLPGFMVRQKSGKYKLILKPLVEITRTSDDEADIQVNTQRFVKVIEDVVREYPDQWFWIHQRWKTKKCQIET